MQDRTDSERDRATAWPPTAEQLIRWSTVAVVVAVAVGAAIVSYRHAYELVRAHGETGTTAGIAPATVDGMIYASSMVILSAARTGRRWRELIRDVWLAYLGLALGIVATVAANVLHGIDHGPVGAVVGAWPAVALVISYETLMLIVRASQPDRTEFGSGPESATPCQCEQSGAQVALTLPEAVALAVELAGSQRQLAEAIGANRKKLSAILNQPAPPDDEVAQINGVGILEPA